jgi:hypothetical protein
MSPPVITPPGLATGEQLSVEDFLRRWDGLPDLKHAELIEGVVYVPSPLSLEHGRRVRRITWWLTQYEDATPGCECVVGSTWLMRGSAPQPDVCLRILPLHGGQSGERGTLDAGAPELLVEISGASVEIDLGPKLALYQRCAVPEYITVEIPGKRLIWRVLQSGVYVDQPIPADGIFRSQVFSGLWLDVAAFWVDDGAKLLAALNTGLASEEHQSFVARLAAAK